VEPQTKQDAKANPFRNEAPGDFVPQKTTLAGNALLTIKILGAAGLTVSLLWLLDN
jgi:hypothetical protein